MGGKGEIPKYWRLFRLFDISVIIVFDNDKAGDKQQRNKIIPDCFGIRPEDIEEGVDVFKHLTISKEGVFEGQDLIILEKDFEIAVKKEKSFDK